MTLPTRSKAKQSTSSGTYTWGRSRLRAEHLSSAKTRSHLEETALLVAKNSRAARQLAPEHAPEVDVHASEADQSRVVVDVKAGLVHVVPGCLGSSHLLLLLPVPQEEALPMMALNTIQDEQVFAITLKTTQLLTT